MLLVINAIGAGCLVIIAIASVRIVQISKAILIGQEIATEQLEEMVNTSKDIFDFMPSTRPTMHDTEIIPALAIGADSVKDWLQHYTNDPRKTWAAAVAEFYRRAAKDVEIADYFRNVNMEQLQKHFTAAIIMITGSGLKASTIDRMASAHANVRDSFGRPITSPMYDRVVAILVGILREWHVPEPAIAELATALAPLKRAIVGVN